MQNLYKALRIIFYGVIVRPILILILGFNVRHFERLKVDGARLIAANHNSHLDTLVLISLFKLSELHKVKVVAAKDYFCSTPLLAWFSINIIGIIPVDRSGRSKNPTKPITDALNEGLTVIIFPEGSRGSPEQRTNLKFGIAKISEEMPTLPVTVVYMYGLGRSLPKGEAMLVPFVCEISVSDPIYWNGDRPKFMDNLECTFDNLAKEIGHDKWQ